MEVLLTITFLEVFLTSALNAYERARRLHILGKWVRGEMKEAELQRLKTLPWFKKAFKEVSVPCEKKND